MKQSDSIGNLAAALAKAQGAMKLAAKDAKNPHLQKSYADLSSVWEACRSTLAANELSVSQLPSTGYDEGQLVLNLTTILMHSSGEWISDEMTAYVVGNKGVNDLQAMGSTVTYLRRYALSAVVGVATGEDDDGATGQVTRKAPARQERPEVTPPPAPVQAADNLFPDALRHQLNALGSQIYGDAWDDKRPELCLSVSKRRTNRSDQLTGEELEKLIKGMKERTNGANGHPTPQPIQPALVATEAPAGNNYSEERA